MADGQAAINRCAPGGAEGVQRLAALTGQPVLPLDPQFGAEGPRSVAWIDENWCIGCTLCIKACPVDCIVGTSKHMHTVIEDDCTGCKLCVTACPVDCIEMENVSADKTGWQAWSQAQADQARQDYEQTRQRRKVTGKPALPSKPPKTNHPAHGPAAVTGLPTTQKPVLQVVKQDAQRKKDAVAAALARARRRRQAHEA